jgi:ABC-type multidrug transport system ATPase subunit
MSLMPEIGTVDSHRIEVQGLTFGYDRARVFQDFSFSSSARVSMFRGPSGCGKTTLLKIFFGLLAPEPGGRLIVPSPSFLVLQADTLVPWFSGRQNIEKFSAPLWDRMREGPFYDLLRPFIEKRAYEMSYGQRRSIELARAFSSGAPLLMFDEPFNFLDPEKRRFFLNHLNGRHGEAVKGRVILTTHYVEDIEVSDADSFEFRGEMPHRALTECSRNAP